MRAHILLSTTLLVSVSALFTPAGAAPCPVQANGSYNINTVTVPTTDCEITSPTPGTSIVLGTGAQFGIGVRGLRTVTVLGDIGFILDSGTSPWLIAGISTTSLLNAPGAVRPSILAGDSTIDIEITNSVSDRIGIYAAFDSLIQVGTANIKMHDLHMENGSIYATGHYGALAGSSTNAGDTIGNFDLLSADIEVGTLNIEMSAGDSSPLGRANHLTGLRAIQGANSQNKGASGSITVSDYLYLDIEANNNSARGLVVSGDRTQINVHDSEMYLSGSHEESAGIQLGKSSDMGRGWGGGKVVSTGEMYMDASGITAGAAIKVLWQGGILDAAGPDSLTTIISGNVGLSVTGNKDESTDETVLDFRDLWIGTVSTTANLIEVGEGQSQVTLSVVGSDNLFQSADEGYLIDIADDSNMDFSIEGGQVVGLTRTAATSTLDMDMSGGTLWALAGKNGADPSTTASFSNLTLSEESALIAYRDLVSPSSFTITGNIISNDSLIVLQNDVVGDTLTIAGNYHGNGTAILALDLGVSTIGGEADLVVIDGGAVTGHTLLHVNDVSLPSASRSPTTGVKVVDAINGATVEDEAFELITEAGQMKDGKVVIYSGAYIYGLHKGALADVDDYGDSEVEHDWYLRSTDADGNAVYQEGAPIYEAYPQILMAMNSLTSLQQRYASRSWVGRSRGLVAEPVADYMPPMQPEIVAEPLRTGFWTEFDGTYLVHDPRRSTTAVDYNVSLYRMRAGVDAPLYVTDAGSFIGSLNFVYTNAGSNIKSQHGRGRVSADGYGFGLSGTWVDNSGFYVDGQAQFNWITANLKSTSLGQTLAKENGGFGYAISGEAGMRLSPVDEISLTPQAQLTYSGIDFSSFTDPMGATVKLGDSESLQGRVGIAIDRQVAWENASGTIDRTYFYGIANIYYEFLSGLPVELAGTSLASRQHDLWGGLGFGGAFSMDNNRWILNGDFAVHSAMADIGDNYSVKGTVGVRVAW